MGRCRRSGRSPDGRAGRAATGRMRHSRRGTISAAGGDGRRFARQRPIGLTAVPLRACSATPPWRRCSSRFGPRPRSRRRSSDLAPRSASACCRRAAACRPSASLAGPAGDLALDASPGADHAGAERSPRRRSRGRTGGTFVAERPPLAEEDGKPLGEEAWAVLDYRVAVETGATILAAERAEAGPARSPRRAGRRRWPARRFRGVPPGRHALPHRDRGGRAARPGWSAR